MRKTLTILILLFLFSLTACTLGGSTEPTATPVDINALQTSVVQTVIAGVTQTVSAVPPTLEPTLTATITPTSGPTETPTITATPTGIICDAMEFVSDSSVPDGTQMTPGQQFVKTWKIKNTGTCTWTQGYNLIFAYGSKLGGQTTALTGDVQPDAETEVSINLTAPNSPDTYSGYWRLTNNNGSPFGTILTVVITVK